MLTQIKFGTSGWRAVVAEEFTFANVQRAVSGIARYVASRKRQGARVIVGRDPRFLGETFAAMAADILAFQGITPLVVDDPAPTPTLAERASVGAFASTSATPNSCSDRDDLHAIRHCLSGSVLRLSALRPRPAICRVLDVAAALRTLRA